MSNFGKETRIELLIISALLILAVATRIYGLSEWALIADEYYTYFDAYDRVSTIMNPAYYFLTVVFFETFGVSELSARFPAFLLGALSVPVFYVTWRRVIGRNAALIAAVLIVLSSWHLWYSQQARFYAGVFIFASLAYYFLFRSIREDKLSYLAWGLLAAILAALFHITAAFILISFGAYCLVVVSLSSARASNSRRVAAIFLAICGVIAVVTLPQVLVIVMRWATGAEPWGHGPVLLAAQVLKYVQIPIGISAFFGLLVLIKKDRWLGAFIAISIGVPGISLLVMSVISSVRPDYMFYVLPLFIALAGVLCAEVWESMKGKGFAAAGVTILVFTSLLPEFVSHFTGRASLDVRDAISFVESNYQPGDRIIPFVNGFNHYANGTYQIDRIAGNSHDNSVNWEERLRDFSEADTRTWIVLPISRELHAKELEQWLRGHGQLVWRQLATRFDYTHRGYEIYLVGANQIHSRQ